MKAYYWIIISPFLLPTLPSWAGTELDEARRAVRMQNFAIAAELFEQAANNGDSEASYQLANLYMLGRGVEKNETIAEQHLSAAASQGHPAALYNLGVRLLERDEPTGMELINKAAQSENQAALNFLAQATTDPGTKDAPAVDALELWLGSARTDDVASMSELLPVMENINSKDENGRTALHIAVQFRSEQVVEWLLQEEARPDSVDRFGLSPLADAIAGGEKTIAKLLLAYAQELSQTLPNGDNLVHLAVRQESPEIAAMLIELGAVVNQPNNDGWTPLDLATQSETVNLAEVLENRGATHSLKWLNLNQQDTDTRQTTRVAQLLAQEEWGVSRLAQLVVSGNAASLQTVLKRQPELANKKLEDGSTLLSLAVKNDLLEAVGVLLNSGADPNQAIYGEITPLHVAAREGNQELMKLLLQHGANPLAQDQDAWDTMEWAVTENKLTTATLLASWLINNRSASADDIPFGRYVLLASQYDITPLVRALLPYAATEEFDDVGRNGVWFAANSGNDALLAILLDAGSTANPSDNQGRTPFHVATQSGCLNCLNLLLPFSTLNQQTNSGFSPLMIAVSGANKELVSWLVRNGADIELRNGKGNTALILAVEQNLIEIARLLLDADANVTRKNDLGYSALDIAKDKNPELYEELRSHTIFGLF